MEYWKEVEGTNGAIEVSTHGRVKSNLRDGRILKATADSKGYLRLRVTLQGVKKSYKVHRLVAQAFIENPEGKAQVNHIDGNKTNNHVENLEWVSNKENARHAISSGLWDSVIKGAKKENENRKKPIIAYSLGTGESLQFESISDAEKTLGTRHITDVLKGKRRQAKGYTFSYAERGCCHGHLKIRKSQ